MNEKPTLAILYHAYLKHVANKPKGYVCELKECAELVKEVEELTNKDNSEIKM